jgi:hypothetical protein
MHTSQTQRHQSVPKKSLRYASCAAVMIGGHHLSVPNRRASMGESRLRLPRWERKRPPLQISLIGQTAD